MPRKRATMMQADPDADFELRVGIADCFGLDDCFETEDQRRRYWHKHRDRLIAEFAADHPGARPWPWWRYETDREKYALPRPDWREHGIEAAGIRADDCEAESVAFVASIGQLDPDELAEIRRRAVEAEERIGTDREFRGTGAYGPDRQAVKVRDAVEAAIEGRG